MKYVALGALFLISSNTLAAPTTQVITAKCMTDATKLDGARKSCTSSPATEITAPDGHVFAQASLKGGLIEKNGSEYGCRPSWDNFVEIIKGSGIEQPKKFSLTSYARSPRGNAKGRGWATCKYTVTLSKYEQ